MEKPPTSNMFVLPFGKFKMIDLIPLFITVPAHIFIRFIFQKFVFSLCRKNKNAYKITESSFYFVQYSIYTLLASKIMAIDHIQPFNYENLYSERLGSVVHWYNYIYVMTELSGYISASIYMMFETRKSNSDFAVLVIHHFVTIYLIIYAIVVRNWHMAVSIASLHDVSDIFLEFSKIINYLGYDTAATISFTMFAVVFMVTRLVVFPIYHILPLFNGKIEQILTDPNFTYSKLERQLLPIFFGTLYVLHCIWSTMIIRMAIKLIIGKRRGDKSKIDDIREKHD